MLTGNLKHKNLIGQEVSSQAYVDDENEINTDDFVGTVEDERVRDSEDETVRNAEDETVMNSEDERVRNSEDDGEAD